ncbi:hypothetical protein CRV02_05680 [Arcobacter sp. CECT 8989]|uniref:AAA family ATPase n=1 Tax=Arcobacter sp. CECT 8989 TaxID=2044509 RepID=UPI00100A97A9|nr:AAA family ATPase [Arcobacter sp. CECT 8989]RXK02329.1 hypothetical protein CRV02_05680 [Arcobacter sp. CECT 8989]
MELVYLWVEKYKNIEKQGFNFSPRFKCEFKDEYDENGKLKDNCELIIDENKEYVSIFPENTNITAIVGENGSGKSRLLEIISLFRFEKLKNSNIFLVFLEKDIFYIPSSKMESYDTFQSFNTSNIHNKTTYNIETKVITSKLYQLSFFSNGLDDLSKKNPLIKAGHYQDFYNGFRGSERFENKFAYLLNKKDDIFSILDKSFLFSTMRIELDFRKIDFDIIDDEAKTKTQKIKYFFEKNIDTSTFILGETENKPTKEIYIYNFLSSFYLDKYIDIVIDFANYTNEKFKSKFFDELINIIEIIINNKKINDSKEKNFAILLTIQNYFNTLEKTINEIFRTQQGQIDHFNRNIEELKSIQNFSNYIQYLNENFQLETKTQILISRSNDINDTNINTFFKWINEDSLYKYLYNYKILTINFFDRKSFVTYKDLSTGEKQILKFIVNLIYTFINLNDNRIILLDEIDLSLHPQWQRELINIIISYIDFLIKHTLISNKYKFQFLVTSHSPFILSDIPKENVIFLEKGKQVYPFEDNQQTFGANIHTLLSHGFFMQDGLMGEFAKDKIQNVINFLNNAKSTIQTKKDAWKIIQIVGEPFLKYKLEEKFHENYSSDKVKNKAKIKRLEEEIERLKNVKPKD